MAAMGAASIEMSATAPEFVPRSVSSANGLPANNLSPIKERRGAQALSSAAKEFIPGSQSRARLSSSAQAFVPRGRQPPAAAPWSAQACVFVPMQASLDNSSGIHRADAPPFHQPSVSVTSLQPASGPQVSQLSHQAEEYKPMLAVATVVMPMQQAADDAIAVKLCSGFSPNAQEFMPAGLQAVLVDQVAKAAAMPSSTDAESASRSSEHGSEEDSSDLSDVATTRQDSGGEGYEVLGFCSTRPMEEQSFQDCGKHSRAGTLRSISVDSTASHSMYSAVEEEADGTSVENDEATDASDQLDDPGDLQPRQQAVGIQDLLLWRAVALQENLQDEAIKYSAQLQGGSDHNKSYEKHEETCSWRQEAAAVQTKKVKDRPPAERRRGEIDKAAQKNLVLPATSPSSWAAQQQKHRQARRGRIESADSSMARAEVARSMKTILNKLTIERFEVLFEKLTTCGIQTTEDVEVLMREVFEKATMQHHFIGMYAELCQRLHQWFVASQGEKQEGGNFKRILLNECQESFEELLRPTELPEHSDAERRTEEQHRHKMKMLGNIRFVGALLEKGMVASRILIAVVEELLSDPTPDTLECLAAFLTAIGAKFDRPAWQHYPALDAAFKQVKAHITAKEFPPRICCLLQDVLDLRQDKWQNKKKAIRSLDGPKTLTAVQAEAEAELGERIVRPAAKAAGGGGYWAWKSTGNYSPSAQAKEAATNRSFDAEKFHMRLASIMRDLRQSSNSEEALKELLEEAVPCTWQAGEYSELLTRISEDASATTRRMAFQVAAQLFLVTGPKAWKRKALLKGMHMFIDGCDDLKLDLPALPKILKDELAPSLTGLIAAGLLPAEKRDELLACAA